VVVALIAAYILKKTVIGRYVYAVGSNEVAAHLSGIKVQRVKIFVYAFCGLLTGIAGVILASRLNSGQPTVGVGYELEAIAAVVIGGTSLMGGIGTIGGTIIGAFIMGVLKNGLNLMGVSQFWQMVAMGVVVIAAVYLDTLRKKFVDLRSRKSRGIITLTFRVTHSERSKTTMRTRNFVYALSLLACMTSSVLAKDMNLPVVSKGFQHEFWQTVKMGTEAAKELGDKTSYVGPADETQIAEQIQLVENAMAQKPNGLLLAALDANALAPLVETANSRGIKVVTFDSGVNSDIPVSFVATNNRKAGAEAADALAAEVGSKGKVGIIAHVAGTSSAIERSEGFIARMKEKYPDIQVLPVQYSDGDPQKAMDKTIDMIQANPDIAGIYGTNEGSTLGVANAIDSQNLKGKVKVIGFDSTEAIIAFLKSE
jgi:ribose transport system substrate-binding protein